MSIWMEIIKEEDVNNLVEICGISRVGNIIKAKQVTGEEITVMLSSNDKDIILMYNSIVKNIKKVLHFNQTAVPYIKVDTNKLEVNNQSIKENIELVR